jgi:predicted transcriptional regulator
MAQEQASRVALLPIQPRYVEAILSGAKRVEFRRRRFGRPICHVVIYATQPVKGIVGFFRVSEVTEASPMELWHRFKHVGGIEEEAFQAYYRGVEQGVAIGIEEVVPLGALLSLESLSASFSVPQSFAYLPDLLFQRVLSRAQRPLEG